MVDGMLKLSNTNREIDVLLPGIFADDGDNFQTTLNLSLIQTFGDSGKYVLMPTLGLTRSEYLKNLQDGRADLVFSAGVSGIWQALDWLSLQTFLNYSTLSTNSKGDAVGASTFDAWDAGLSVTASYYAFSFKLILFSGKFCFPSDLLDAFMRFGVQTEGLTLLGILFCILS